MHISLNAHKSKSNADVSSFSGIGKKRTFRELERWENSEPEPFDDGCAHSVADRQGAELDDSTIENVSIKTLKFNNRLLCKASAAVDLIS